MGHTQPVQGRDLPRASEDSGSAKPCLLRSGLSPFACYGLVVHLYAYLLTVWKLIEGEILLDAFSLFMVIYEKKYQHFYY